MTYSIQFRKKVLSKLDKGESIRQVAAQFEISPTTILSWKKQLAPKATRNRKSIKIDDEALKRDVEQYPDDYQFERAKRFNCSPWAIGKALRRVGISQKKVNTPSKSG